MLRCISLLGMVVIVSLLTGCLPRQDYQYIPPTSAPAQKCITSCKIASNSCKQICALTNPTCRAEMQIITNQRYANYKMQCQSKGVPATKSYESFSRTSTCAHSCNCIPAYNTCYRPAAAKAFYFGQ